MSNDNKIAYAHESHREFNKRFDPPVPESDVKIDGPWMKPETLQNLPHLREDFDQSRKSHTDRPARPAETKQTTGKTKQDKPEPALKPPRPARGRADADGSLKSQLDAALALPSNQERVAKQERERELSPKKSFTGPSL